jgi:hypothetical protein
MKRRSIAAFLAAMLPSCANVDLSARCAAALAASARNEKLEAATTGSRVTVAGTNLQVDARIEQEEQSGSQWLVAIAVRASVGNGASLVAGSVGVGTSRGDALDTAIDEWVQLAGVALVRSLVLRERSAERFAVDGAVVYPGATGIRGPAQPPWSKEDHERLLELLLPSVGRLDDGQPHALSLIVVVDPTKAVQGECRWDNTASPSLLDAAMKFPWPRLKTTYMFKQYYVAEWVQ